MSFDDFKKSVDSLIGFPEMACKIRGITGGPLVGIMGGEPTLHPQFQEFSEYLHSKFRKEFVGLWSTFPPGMEKYRELICEVYGHVLLNDHSIDTVAHHSFLISNDEVFQDKDEMWFRINNCPYQNGWSASINPKGAWFCELAGSLSLLLDEDGGWEVKPGWWKKTVLDYGEQVKKYCPICGGAANLPRRFSTEKVDDISPKNLERLKAAGRKIDMDRYVISDCKEVEPKSLPAMAAYKDFSYRQGIAAKYGMFLTINEQGFWTPHLKKHKGERDFFEPKPIFEIYKERWA